MDRFWDLLEQNVLVSSAIALMLLGAVIYCVIAGIEMPDVLTGAAWLVLGYFFGAKTQGVANRKRAS
jgi:hypothetical protein